MINVLMNYMINNFNYKKCLLQVYPNRGICSFKLQPIRMLNGERLYHFGMSQLKCYLPK